MSGSGKRGVSSVMRILRRNISVSALNSVSVFDAVFGAVIGDVVSAVGVAVLRVVDAVVVVDGGLLLDDLASGAGTGHRGTQEDVDQQHDGEQDSERDAQP